MERADGADRRPLSYIKAPEPELYDLTRDPHERDNIAADRAAPANAMRTALDRLTAGSTIPRPAAVSADARERLQALGYSSTGGEVSSDVPDALPDPKEKREVLQRYREAIDLAADHKWAPAITELQQILRADPEMADVWSELAQVAVRTDRFESRDRGVQTLHRAASIGSGRVFRGGHDISSQPQVRGSARARGTGCGSGARTRHAVACVSARTAGEHRPGAARRRCRPRRGAACTQG